MVAFLTGLFVGVAIGYLLCGLLTRRRIEDEVDAVLQRESGQSWENWR